MAQARKQTLQVVHRRERIDQRRSQVAMAVDSSLHQIVIARLDDFASQPELEIVYFVCAAFAQFFREIAKDDNVAFGLAERLEVGLFDK